MGRKKHRQQARQTTTEDNTMKTASRTQELVAEASQKQEQTPPPIPQDKATEVAKAEEGFLDKAKNTINGIYESVKGFFVSIWNKVTGFFSKDSMRSTLSTLKMAAGVAACAGVAWLLGSFLIATFGLTTVIVGATVASIGAYGAKRYMDYSDEKATNPNAKYEFDIIESINPLAVA